MYNTIGNKPLYRALENSEWSSRKRRFAHLTVTFHTHLLDVQGPKKVFIQLNHKGRQACKYPEGHAGIKVFFNFCFVDLVLTVHCHVWLQCNNALCASIISFICMAWIKFVCLSESSRVDFLTGQVTFTSPFQRARVQESHSSTKFHSGIN